MRYHIDCLGAGALDPYARRGSAGCTRFVDQRLAEVFLFNFIGLLEAEGLAGSERAYVLPVTCEAIGDHDAIQSDTTGVVHPDLIADDIS